ncbi:hypothetical protein [Faecalibaculum rodentium]|uniref:hypothetical protein n=1 Tax=Faecalibaculum rodentium TaxID=1702221 RepID=UPI00256ECA7D|nr:hypothetical protein [Faecalibaculum rodentium]
MYISFNLTMVDDGEGRIEDHALIGPGVTLISGSHPNDPMLRKDLWQHTDPVQVGENAWIDASAIVLPGVSIGRGSVFGLEVQLHILCRMAVWLRGIHAGSFADRVKRTSRVTAAAVCWMKC